MIQGEIKKLRISEINNEGEGIIRLGDERFVVFVVSCKLKIPRIAK